MVVYSGCICVFFSVIVCIHDIHCLVIGHVDVHDVHVGRMADELLSQVALMLLLGNCKATVG